VTGIVFDIKEFAVFDGPGIRTTVFLKGCPLRCPWCHNPEGLSPEPEVIRHAVGQRLVGERWEAGALAARLNSQADILRDGGGGVTFSGGEPLLQAEFVAEVVQQLAGLHVLLDTSGYGPEHAFRRLLSLVGTVFFDLKLVDAGQHQRYTGRDNGPILRNLHILAQSGCSYVVRVPLVPGITDTPANLTAIAALCQGLQGLQRVDLLPYNRAAGGKYAACGRRFGCVWNEARESNADTAPFDCAGVPVRVV
jgi:pyruvate formate lyase activating enzyme